MKPRIPITDKRFRYTPACATNVAETFRKERERLAQEKQGWRAGMTPRTLVRAI